jgi:cytochrome c5
MMKLRPGIIAFGLALSALTLPGTARSGDLAAEALEKVTQLPAETGRRVYEGTCVACHARGVMGAPRFGSSGEWGERVDKGMETLVRHALEGYQGEQGFMPAKGGNSKLSPAEVASAVRYMVEKSR